MAAGSSRTTEMLPGSVRGTLHSLSLNADRKFYRWHKKPAHRLFRTNSVAKQLVVTSSTPCKVGLR
jgi:hypothetical protein